MQSRLQGGYSTPILEQMTKKTEKRGILFYLFYEEYSILIKKARTKIGSCNLFVQNAQKDIEMCIRDRYCSFLCIPEDQA